MDLVDQEIVEKYAYRGKRKKAFADLIRSTGPKWKSTEMTSKKETKVQMDLFKKNGVKL